MSEDAALADLGRRFARARLAAGLTQAGLARRAGVSKHTVARLEGGEGVHLASLMQCLRALGLSGDLARLIPDLPRPPGQRSKSPGGAASPWTWNTDG